MITVLSMPRLIEWDAIEVRISGEKMNEIARSVRIPPIEGIQLRFSNGSMRVEGTIRKFIAVPFAVEIGEILASGTTIRVPVKSASAFGAIPIRASSSRSRRVSFRAISSAMRSRRRS